MCEGYNEFHNLERKKIMDFNRIPCGASKEELDKYLSNFLENKEKLIQEKGIIYTLEQLSKIAEEYSYSDYKLEKEKTISDFLIKTIDFNNKELIDIISFITINMSLYTVANYMRKHRKKVNEEIKQIIDETLHESDEILAKKNIEELKLRTTKLLQKMQKENLKGTYRIKEPGLIEWQIEDTIKVLIEFEDVFSHFHDDLGDVIIIIYKDHDGKQYNSGWMNYFKTITIEDLKKYNNYKYKIKEKGLLTKRYKLYIKENNHTVATAPLFIMNEYNE